jgi:hypothetical protein
MNARFVIALVVMIALVAACGCTGTTPTLPAGTATPAGTAPQQTGTGLTPGPTDAIPEYTAVTVDVGEKEFDGSIPVIFRGGLGLVHTKKIDVKLTRTDGSIQAATIGAKVGDEAILQGTRGEPGLRGQPDRIEVWVTMDNGQTYKIVDVLREYRTRP